MKQKILNYTVVFQKEKEGGYTVFVPMLPGCVSYGRNLEEAKKMIEDAIKLYLESLIAHSTLKFILI
jgi:antitoxin HicB